MLKFIRRKKKPRPDKPAAELPADVLAIIEGLSVVARSSDDEGRPRVLVQVHGRRTAWHHSQEETGGMIEKMFPELNPAQIERAVLVINSMAKRALAADHYSRQPNRKKWSATEW